MHNDLRVTLNQKIKQVFAKVLVMSVELKHMFCQLGKEWNIETSQYELKGVGRKLKKIIFLCFWLSSKFTHALEIKNWAVMIFFWLLF